MEKKEEGEEFSRRRGERRDRRDEEGEELSRRRGGAEITEGKRGRRKKIGDLD